MKDSGLYVVVDDLDLTSGDGPSARALRGHFVRTESEARPGGLANLPTAPTLKLTPSLHCVYISAPSVCDSDSEN